MWISSTGLACPVGLSARAACAAMRAGVAIASELPHLTNQGKAATGSFIQALPLDIPRADRLVAMLSRAVLDCVTKAANIVVDTTPIMVVMPRADHLGWCSELAGSKVVSRLQAELGWAFEASQSLVLETGAVGMAQALEAARTAMQEAGMQSVLVCGVDSLLDVSTLQTLEKQERLKTLEKPDGLIPGEGAACLWLTATPLAPHSPKVLSVGLATESATILNEEPFRGDGIVSAASQALESAGLTMSDIHFRVCDATGESYGLREQAILAARLLREPKDDFELWHPAEFTGCTGAAAGLLQLAMVEDAHRAEYAPGARSMICCSEPTGERAVTLLQGPLEASDVPPSQERA